MDNAGQDRVNKREINNRRGERATGMGTKTPRKSGAKSGFGSNKIKNKGKGSIAGNSRP